MGLEAKWGLYFMIYRSLFDKHKDRLFIAARGNGKFLSYFHFVQEALKRTNYVLATIDEKLELEDLLNNQK